MDSQLLVARHFARLVSLLAHERDAIAEQKGALRAMMTLVKGEGVRLERAGRTLLAGGAAVPEAFTGVEDLAARFAGLGARALVIDAGAGAGEVLGAARALADAGPSQFEGTAVRWELEPAVAPPSRSGAPPRLHHDAAPAVAPHPATAPRTEPTRAPAAAHHDDEIAPIAREHAVVDPSELPALAPVVTRAPAAVAPAAAALAPEGPPAAAAALAAVDAAVGDTALHRALEALTEVATRAARDDDRATVIALWRGVQRREPQARGVEARAAYIDALARLSRPTVMRAVAAATADPALARDAAVVLARAGAEGAGVLVELLSASPAPTAAARAAYFDAFAKLDAAVPTLVRMLRDARWHVARDAAVLLGELRATAAEGPLADQMVHEDDRVRRAVAVALGRLSSPEAVRALRGALGDVAPTVRAQAAICLAEREGASSADTLATALDAEEDSEVQHAILAALGRLGTPDAVQRLIRAAEPDRRLFRKKPVPLRVAAARALGEATSAAAVAALQALANDKEREVREAAVAAAQERAARERAARGRPRSAHA